jgi:hypothetical protein
MNGQGGGRMKKEFEARWQESGITTKLSNLQRARKTPPALCSPLPSQIHQPMAHIPLVYREKKNKLHITPV